MIKKMKDVLKGAFYTATAAVLSMPIYAQNLADTMDGLTEASTAGVKLVFVASALIGVGLMVAGGLQLKKYADNPQQNGIAKPMIYILAGVVVFGVAATSDTMEETLFGGVSDTKGAQLDQL